MARLYASRVTDSFGSISRCLRADQPRQSCRRQAFMRQLNIHHHRPSPRDATRREPSCITAGERRAALARLTLAPLSSLKAAGGTRPSSSLTRSSAASMAADSKQAGATSAARCTHGQNVGCVAPRAATADSKRAGEVRSGPVRPCRSLRAPAMAVEAPDTRTLPQEGTNTDDTL